MVDGMVDGPLNSFMLYKKRARALCVCVCVCVYNLDNYYGRSLAKKYRLKYTISFCFVFNYILKYNFKVYDNSKNI